MSQHAYICLEPLSNRVYVSRHVKFVENSFPYQSIVTPSPVQTLPTFDSPIHNIINVPREPTNTAPVTSLQDQVDSSRSAVPVPTQTPTCCQLPESPVLSLENALSLFPTPAPSMLESQSLIQSSVPESTSASVPVSELPRLESNLQTCSITNNNYDAPNMECTKPAVRDPLLQGLTIISSNQRKHLLPPNMSYKKIWNRPLSLKLLKYHTGEMHAQQNLMH